MYIPGFLVGISKKKDFDLNLGKFVGSGIIHVTLDYGVSRIVIAKTDAEYKYWCKAVSQSYLQERLDYKFIDPGIGGSNYILEYDSTDASKLLHKYYPEMYQNLKDFANPSIKLRFVVREFDIYDDITDE